MVQVVERSLLIQVVKSSNRSNQLKDFLLLLSSDFWIDNFKGKKILVRSIEN